MENFIPIIFVLIFIFSILSRKKARKDARTGGKPAPTGSLAQRLNAFLTDVQKRIEQEAAAAKGTPDVSGWSQLVDDDEEESLEGLVLEADERVVMPPPAPKPSPPPKRREQSRIRRVQDVAAPPRQKPEPAPAAKTVQRRSRGFDRAALRRAIVWSEIIGPPVALRENNREPL